MGKSWGNNRAVALTIIQQDRGVLAGRKINIQYLQHDNVRQWGQDQPVAVGVTVGEKNTAGLEKGAQRDRRKVHSMTGEKYTAGMEKSTQQDWRKLHSLNGEKYTARLEKVHSMNGEKYTA